MSSTGDLVMDREMESDAKRDQNAPKTFKTMTIREKLHYAKEVVTIEPIITAYVMASIVCGPALFNLEFEKACRVNLALNDSICDVILYGDSTNLTAENDQIQTLIGKMHSWQSPLQSVMPLILILFLGSYSDRHKMRKPFLLIPLFGEFFAVAGCILCVVFMKTLPLEAQGVFQTVVPSFFGGQTMITMAVFAYIADVSTLEMRTLRIGIVQICLNVAVPVAQSVSGILFEEIGYIGVLAIAAALYLFAVLYGIFCVKEPKKPDVVDKKSFIADAFDPKHALETFGLLLKKSPGNNRLFIGIVLIILFVYSLVVTGEAGIFYLYVQGVFQWTPLKYSYYITANTVIHLIGTMVGVPLLSNYFKLGDLMILTWSFLDKVISNFLFVIANTDTMLYVVAFVSIITGLSSIAIRSLATKIVSSNDLGKAQSLFGICEALGPAIGAPIYNALYINTLKSFPAAYFAFGAILYLLCVFVVIWMYFRLRRKRQKATKQETINGETNNGYSNEEYQTTHI